MPQRAGEGRDFLTGRQIDSVRSARSDRLGRRGHFPSTAIAALWPGMPLTPPPRTAPAPHSSTLAWRGLHAPAARCPPGAYGKARSRWKMLPPGSRRSRSRSSGVFASMHGRPSASYARQSAIGSARCASSWARVALSSSSRAASWSCREQPGGRVQPEQGQGLVAPRGQVRAEDRRVGQRVAVDLGRRRGAAAPPRRPAGTRVAKLLVALGDVEGPGERLARVDARGPAAAGSRRSSMLTFSWAPSAGGAGGSSPSRPRQLVRGGADQHVAGAPRCPRRPRSR